MARGGLVAIFVTRSVAGDGWRREEERSTLTGVLRVLFVQMNDSAMYGGRSCGLESTSYVATQPPPGAVVGQTQRPI